MPTARLTPVSEIDPVPVTWASAVSTPALAVPVPAPLVPTTVMSPSTVSSSEPLNQRTPVLKSTPSPPVPVRVMAPVPVVATRTRPRLMPWRWLVVPVLAPTPVIVMSPPSDVTEGVACKMLTPAKSPVAPPSALASIRMSPVLVVIFPRRSSKEVSAWMVIEPSPVVEMIDAVSRPSIASVEVRVMSPPFEVMPRNRMRPMPRT